jgi:hypothetical protein
MKTTFTKALLLAAFLPIGMKAQIDLTIGLNYSYNPPSSCNNKITQLTFDVCNNGNSAAGSFLVGAYLYLASSQEHWVVDQTTINSLSGNACVSISNWDIDFNNYPSLPAPGTNYRLGVWADTANAITESNKNNNASLLSGNIQVCAAQTGIKKETISLSRLSVSPNPVLDRATVELSLTSADKNVKVSVVDLTGRLVCEIFDGGLPQGDHKISFETSNFGSGVYFVNVSTSGGRRTAKIAVQ